jgi:hypothetical protein
MIKIIILYFMIAFNSLYAQVTQEWVAKFKDTVYSEPRSITADKIGNTYISGYYSSTGGTRFLTLKYNSSGILQWKRLYKEPQSLTNTVVKNISDRLGNLYVMGFSEQGVKVSDIILIKYDTYGDSVWVRKYKGRSIARDMVVDKYSNVYITAASRGITSNDYQTLKYDSSGNLLWNAIYTSGEVPNAMALDSSGNVYVTGESSSFFTEYLTVKYSNSGVLQWVRTHGSALDAEGTSIAVDLAGNIYVTGLRTSSIGNTSYSTLKYNTLGDLQWGREFNTFDQDIPNQILVDTSGNCIVSGNTAIIKYNRFGDLNWIDSSTFNNYLQSILDTRGNLYISRTTFITKVSNYFTTIKYGVNGNILWVSNYGGGEMHIYRPAGITLDQNNNVLATGSEFLNGTLNSDTLITIKYSQTTGTGNYDNTIPQYHLYQNYPNPFNPKTDISYQLSVSNIVSIKVYDVLGNEKKTLVNKKQNSGNYKIDFDGSNLPSGIYFYKFTSGSFSDTKRMILLK